ncbi:MAG: hypothetical protein CL666_14715 [Balneola sp.]|nr:hypothetical protein [Balneola sp.]|tara:strand:+ start:9239 stop:9550 length:312 start_codon:yes stop_codon:yes gene_type:complete
MAETIILTEPWTLKTGVEKNAGTEITFSRSSEEMQKILDAGAGQVKQGLPGDLPGRKHFVDAGFDSVQSLGVLEEWTQVNGVGPKTAKELDEYFQTKQNTEVE